MGLIVTPNEHKVVKQNGLHNLFDFGGKPMKENSLIEIVKSYLFKSELNKFIPYKPKDYLLYPFKIDKRKDKISNLIGTMMKLTLE